MSATLIVELDPGPLERTRADVAVICFFETDRPLRGGAGRADWRLCGQISELIVAGKLSGANGEAVLLPSGGGLASTLLIGLGLGARNRFDIESCEALGRDAADRARRLGARTLALPLPDPHAGDLEVRERLEALVNGAVEAMAGVSARLELRLIPSTAELAAARAAVATLVPRPVPSSVSLHFGGEPAAAVSSNPRGADRFSREPPQTIK